MESEEPSASLIDTFSDEVGWIACTIVENLLIFKWIVDLCVRHRTTVKPHVYKVGLALHWLARWTHEHDVIDIRTMQVDLLIVVLCHLAWLKALVLVWVARHETSSNGFLDLVVELLNRTDADLLACVAVAPDWKRSTPVA